jgi:AraC-like DNA-binding protein
VRGVTFDPQPRIRDNLVREIAMRLLAAMIEREATDVADLVGALTRHLAGRFLAAAPQPVVLGRRPLLDVLDDFRLATAATGTVTDVARRCGLTRAHFTRRFRAMTGMSPHSMLLGSRVEHAKQLMTSGRRSISEAAYESGFGDQSHLANTFRRLVGMTPRRFRELDALTSHRVHSTILQDRP